MCRRSASGRGCTLGLCATLPNVGIAHRIRMCLICLCVCYASGWCRRSRLSTSLPGRFVKYNDLLRGFGPALEGCKGNHYVTTTHVINSAIVKSSKLTKARKVYRGVTGGMLPESF